MALVCALATSALVLVTFLASNLVLSVVAGIGPGDRAAATQPPPAAVLLSSERQTERPAAEGTTGCDRRSKREPSADQRGSKDVGRCAGQRRSVGSHRP